MMEQADIEYKVRVLKQYKMFHLILTLLVKNWSDLKELLISK